MKALWKLPPAFRKYFRYFGFALGGSIFLYQLIMGMTGFIGGSYSINALYLLLYGLIAAIIVRGIQLVAWRYIMSALSYELPWLEVVTRYTLSLLPRYIPGSVWGYLSRAEWLFVKYKIPYVTTNLSSFIEILLVVASFFQFMCIYLILILGNWLGFLLLIGCGVLFILPALFVKLLPRIQLVREHIFRDFLTNSVNWSSLIAAQLMYFLAWIGYGGLLQLSIRAMAIYDYNNLPQSTFVFGLSWLIGFLIVFVPSGLGIREQTLSTLLHTLAFIELPLANAISVVSRLMIILSEFIWLVIGALVRFVSPKENDGSITKVSH